MKLNYKKLGDYIQSCDLLNTSGEISILQGISNEKYFQGCKSNKNDIDLYRYRICQKGWFAYNRATTRNGDKISIAFRDTETCLVSPSYKCFKIIDEDILNPQYLLLWFKRNEFDRYARYKSHGSAHEYFEFEEMCKVELPVPPIEKQREIVAAYKAITERIELKKKINDNLLASTDAIFSKMFFENKTDSTVSFTDVVQLMGGGTPKTDEDNYWDGNILFFTPKDISNSPFCIATEKHLSENGLKNCSSRLYPSYTTFVTCRGTVGNLSMAGVPMAMNQSCYALKGKKKYPPFFVYSFTRYVIATMKKKASGAVFSALVTRDFEMEKVFEPDIYTALQYHACATPLFDEILSNTKEIQSLTELSQVLLSQLSR